MTRIKKGLSHNALTALGEVPYIIYSKIYFKIKSLDSLHSIY